MARHNSCSSEELSEVALERSRELSQTRERWLVLAMYPVMDRRFRYVDTTSEFGIADPDSITSLNDASRYRLSCHSEPFAYTERESKTVVRLSRMNQELG